MVFAKDSLSTNAMGGTELMKMRLLNEFGEDYLSQFKIFVSRAHEEIDKNKINLYWHQDLPQDPACSHLANGGWSKYDFFIFNSNWQMQQFNLILGIPYQKSIVIQNAIEPISVKNKNKQKIKLIYTSTPHRGLKILVPVFDKLCEKYPNIELDVYSSFKIYGWGERDLEFGELFEQCKNHPNINYYGSVDNKSIRNALSEAHIFAYPSIWVESSCIALIEAMSAGLICVHPNLGALYDTSGGITRMYQWSEDINQHSIRFYNVLDTTINEINKNLLSDESNYIKIYADNRFDWNKRKYEWKSFLDAMIQIKFNK